MGIEKEINKTIYKTNNPTTFNELKNLYWANDRKLDQVDPGTPEWIQIFNENEEIIGQINQLHRG